MLAGAAGLVSEPVRPLRPGRRAGPQSQGQSQVGDPDLDVGRAAAHRHLRPQAGRGLRLLRSPRQAHRNQRLRHPHQRTAATLAKQADKYSIIRSMTHGIFAHETASYATQTGRMPGDRQVYPGPGRWFRSSAVTTPATRGSCRPISCSRNRKADSPRRASWASLQAIRHRRRPFAGPLCRGRRGGAGHHRPAAEAPPRAARRTQFAGACRSRTTRGWRACRIRKSRPTT